MIEYMRIPKSKFWGWVFSSLAFGLVVGIVVMLVLGTASANKQINAAKQQLAEQTAQSKTTVDGLNAQLASTEASLTSLSGKYNQLLAEKTAVTSKSSSSTASADVLAVVSRTVIPDSVTASDTITLSAKVTGSPSSVTMRILAKTGSYDQTVTLKKTSSTSTTETWKRTIKAPSKKGTYRYYATATLNGKSVTMPGASPSTFVVK